MNRRKPCGEGYRGLAGPIRRPSIGNIRTRGANVIHRKPGAMNVRPIASRRLLTSIADIRRISHNPISNAGTSHSAKENATRVPKTRFSAEHRSSNVQTSYTPRLKSFPTETVKRVDNSPRFPPGLTTISNLQERQNNTSPDCTNTLQTNNGFGDMSRAYHEMQVMQNHPATENKTQIASMSQQHMPNSEQMNKVNQSEVILTSQALVTEKQARRPFVPNMSHGMAVRDSSPQKESLSPSLPINRDLVNNPQQQCTVVAPQQPSFPASLPQQQPQIQEQINTASHPQQTPSRQQGKPAWMADDTSPPSYEKQPIGGRSSTVPLTSASQEKKQNHSVPPDGIRQLEYSDYVPSSLPDTQQNLSSQYPVDTCQRQNPQQMFQQMQNNIVNQQQMQQRAFSHQQQMLAAQQPLAQQLQISAQQMQMGQSPHNVYNAAQQISRRQFGISGSGMTSPQDVNVNQTKTPQTALPYRQMVSQQQNSGYPITPQNGWVQNNQVIGDHPSVKTQLKAFAVDLIGSDERGLPQTGTAQYQQFKQNEAQLMAAQQTARQQTAMQWQPQMQYQQFRGMSPQQSIQVSSQNKPILQQNLVPDQNELHKHEQMQQQYIIAQQQRTMQQSQTMPQQKHQQEIMGEPVKPVQNKFQAETQQQELIGESVQSVKKQSLNFTPEMIRDQELLVTNLRQQRIPEDTMQRQFNALLNEQKKYLMHMNQQETLDKNGGEPVRRKVSTIQGDQRPEWMGRITPARMSYRDIERLRNNPLLAGNNLEQKQNSEDEKRLNQYNQMQPTIIQQNASSTQQQLQTQRSAGNMQRQPVSSSQYQTQQDMMNQKATGMQPQQVSPSQQVQTHRAIIQQNAGNMQFQQIPPPQQLHTEGQQDGYQLWQQQTANWQQKVGSPPPPYKYATQQYYQCRSGAAQPSFVQGTQHQSQQQQVQYQQQQQQKAWQAQQPQHQNLQQPQYQQQTQGQVPQQPQALRYNPDNMKEAFQQFRYNIGNDELSSLLKMREYNKIIRPQRQNNGLQDPQTVLEAFEALKHSENKKGLEYMARLDKKDTFLKLNGTQNPSQMVNIPGPPLQHIPQSTVPSNGLENSRNANNPATQPFSFPKKPEGPKPFGYPCHPRNRLRGYARTFVAEREHESVAESLNQQQGYASQAFKQPVQRYGPTNPVVEQQLPSQQGSQAHGVPIQVQGKHSLGASQGQQSVSYNGRNPMTARNLTMMPYRFEATEPQVYHQMQQFYRNQQNFRKRGEGDEPLAKDSMVQGKMNVFQSSVAGGDAIELPEPKPQKLQKLVQSSHQNGTANMPVQAYSSQGYAQIAQNKQAVAEYLQMQQTTNNVNNYGQPELRQAKTIGGLTYLARKPDYTSIKPLVAPDTLIATKFLQPAATFV